MNLAGVLNSWGVSWQTISLNSLSAIWRYNYTDSFYRVVWRTLHTQKVSCSASFLFRSQCKVSGGGGEEGVSSSSIARGGQCVNSISGPSPFVRAIWGRNSNYTCHTYLPTALNTLPPLVMLLVSSIYYFINVDQFQLILQYCTISISEGQMLFICLCTLQSLDYIFKRYVLCLSAPKLIQAHCALFRIYILAFLQQTEVWLLHSSGSCVCLVLFVMLPPPPPKFITHF